MRDPKEITKAEVKSHLHQLFDQGNPGGDIIGGCASQSGNGFATGDHLEAIIYGQEFLRYGYRENKNIKQTALEFLKEFVKNAYSAEVFSFLIGAYKGEDLTPEVWDEIRKAFNTTVEPFNHP